MGRERIGGIRRNHGAIDCEEETVRKRAVPSALNLDAPLSFADVLQLQRVAGNRATQALLVQRRMTTDAKTLDGFTTGGAPGTSTLGKVKGALSGSSFNAIRDALVRYEKAKTVASKVKLLQDVEVLATKWVNEHSKDGGAIERRRRSVLVQLLDEVPQELTRLSTEQAQGIYMGNVTNAGAPDDGAADPGKKYALKGLSENSRASGLQRPPKAQPFIEAAGLTEAEITAVRIFSADDYKYINPGVKNDPSWLEGNRVKHATAIAFRTGAADDVYLEEGRVHAGIMNQALRKLPPDPSVVYRGATQTDAEFKAQVGVGKVFHFPSFASASKDRSTAEGFADTNGKDHALIFRIHNSGGRDISQISAVASEEEVTLLAGSKYSVQSVTQIPPLKAGDTRTWHEVILAP